MPKIGRPLSHRAGSGFGPSASYTELGLPLKMMPAGLRATISLNGVSKAISSECTFSSRTRRAMSCANWLPKSSTRMPPCVGVTAPLAPTLPALPFGRCGRGVDHLNVAEAAHVLYAEGRS